MLAFTYQMLVLIARHVYDTACKKFRRRQEPPYANTIYAREFHNTLCTLPFVIVGVLRIATSMWNGTAIVDAYVLMVLLGFIMMWNHAVFVDDLLFEYVPMAIFVYTTATSGMYSEMSLVSLWYFLLAAMVLAIDYICDLGFLHSVWHILIATAFDVAFTEKMNAPAPVAAMTVT